MASQKQSGDAEGRFSSDSLSSVSTTSLVFERISERVAQQGQAARHQTSRRPKPDLYAALDDEDPLKDEGDGGDLETGPFLGGRGSGDDDGAKLAAAAGPRHMDRSLRRILLVVSGLCVAGWTVALFVFLSSGSLAPASQQDGVEHDPAATASRGSGKKITLDEVMGGRWAPQTHDISWIESPEGPGGRDGLLLEHGAPGKDYLVVEDVRSRAGLLKRDDDPVAPMAPRTLMRSPWFSVEGGRQLAATGAWPSPDMTKVLVATETEKLWRHSKTARYWIFDVASQRAEPLDPNAPDARVQLALWSPKSDAVVFTRDNDMYLRKLADGSKSVVRITKDGSDSLFYGVPDWVYEEEVLSSGGATWWSQDGRYVAFLRTNESGVPDYPIQYFVSRPSGKDPEPGEEAYPDVRQIKYPKAGAPNPVVHLQFFDVTKGDVFTVKIDGGFADDDRLITSVLWAGTQVVIKETNRVSDIMRVVVVDVIRRTGKAVRTIDVGKLDGGWFEISQKARYVPADESNGRPYDGYIDTIIHDDGDHLAYYTPIDNPEPIMLTSGKWEVDEAPSAVDLKNNLVYFVATKESSIQRHVYSVKLDGTSLVPYTDTSAEGYYDVSFSAGAGYALVTYRGPKIPWQKVLSTPGNPRKFELVIEQNKALSDAAASHEMPLLVYGTLNVDGVELNYVERRPPFFDEKCKYPVLFYQYSGPGSQSVTKQFRVDFQSYVAANLGYIVVTVDGRGTGFIGRKARVVVRKNLGHWEAHDQIAAAKHWAARPYVDESRIAIWGWSYGGFQTLKTLEQDAGRTFRYGMAVAPVTDWRFYDSIYTERYMLTPQMNPGGYAASAVSNVTALAKNVRFLIMHGVADDNVHLQNTLTLLDELDMAGIENYDVHVFPDSDHSIYFHNANRIVYDSKFPAAAISLELVTYTFPVTELSSWLINAFNGEWLKIDNPKPTSRKRQVGNDAPR